MIQAEWTAVVLAGGRSSRFGSDKITATLRGSRLIDLVLVEIPGSVPVVIAGPDPGLIPRQALVVREEPRYGGPVAAIAAALPHVATARMVIIAADMPGAAPHLGELVSGLPADADGLMPIDEAGRLQILSGAYWAASLDAAIHRISDPDATGLAMNEVVSRLHIRTVAWPHARTWDVDTPADLALGEHILSIKTEEGVADEDGEAGHGEG